MLRQQALAWLTADLLHWSQEAGSTAIERRELPIEAVAHWKADPDLAAIRGEAAINTLPESERVGWTRLWGSG